jgi:hypothetical protein
MLSDHLDLLEEALNNYESFDQQTFEVITFSTTSGILVSSIAAYAALSKNK